MSEFRFLLLYILMSMASCMYAQGNCQKVSPMKILQKERVKEFSFTMYYHTRTMNHKYGNIYLKGCIKHGTTRLYLNKLQDSNRKKAKWVKHFFNTSVIMEDSLTRLIDSLFISKRVPPILEKEKLDIMRYDEQNCLQIMVKRKKEYERYVFYFGDYLQTQITSDVKVTYSPQMIKLLKMIEIVVKNETARIKEDVLFPKKS